jgi:hypothetical protein
LTTATEFANTTRVLFGKWDKDLANGVDNRRIALKPFQLLFDHFTGIILDEFALTSPKEASTREKGGLTQAINVDVVHWQR